MMENREELYEGRELTESELEETNGGILVETAILLFLLGVAKGTKCK